MKYIIHQGTTLPELAGREVWLMGYTEEETGILQPIRGYLQLTFNDDFDDVGLIAYMVETDGTIEPVFDQHDMKDVGGSEENETFIFIAKNKEDLFDIPEVKKIIKEFSTHIHNMIEYRKSYDDKIESIFFENHKLLKN